MDVDPGYQSPAWRLLLDRVEGFERIAAQDLLQAAFKVGVHPGDGFPFEGVLILEMIHDLGLLRRDCLAAGEADKYLQLVVEADAPAPEELLRWFGETGGFCV